ncbi:MAG: tRNA (adenosine(37)-N6)-threonylcarbamoyltransferase complex transferase subunit TsaD [Candidatus Limnocylindrales bacterium]
MARPDTGPAPASEPELRVLAIESSCDETAVAVVEGGRAIAASVVASQTPLHAPTGGIVPEVAARAHLRWMLPVLDEALVRARLSSPADVDAIAVTNGPGLAGSLLVGLSMAKTLAFLHDRPLVAVNHLEGHIHAAWLHTSGETRPTPAFPAVALVVSGGHTLLVEMQGPLEYRLLGRTVDDAAGEAFDKVGRMLGLPYPGGPAIQRAAAAWATDGHPGAGDRAPRDEPSALPRAWLGDTLDFSFSGLKTAVRRRLFEACGGTADDGVAIPADLVGDIATAFQASVVDVLATKTALATERIEARSMIIGGGVAANVSLRAAMAERAAALGVDLVIPAPSLCTDNAAMIGAAGSQRFLAGERAGLDLGASPSLRLAVAR